MNFWRKTLNSSERSQPLRDPQQITFIMLVRFWSLRKKPFILLLLTDNINLDGIPTKIKLKIHAYFTIEFQVLRRYFCEDAATSSFVSCFGWAFLSADIIFVYNFLELYSTLSEKDFCHKFSFSNRFTQTSHPLNSQNLLSVTNFFVNFS